MRHLCAFLPPAVRISLTVRRTWEFRTCTTISVCTRPRRRDRHWRVCRSADSEELERSLSQSLDQEPNPCHRTVLQCASQLIRVKIKIKNAPKWSKPLFKCIHRDDSRLKIATTRKTKNEWTNNQPSTIRKKSNDCWWQEQAVKYEEYVFTKRRQITDIKKQYAPTFPQTCLH